MKIDSYLPERTGRKRKREGERKRERQREKKREGKTEWERDREREQGQIKHQRCKTTIALTEVKGNASLFI